MFCSAWCTSILNEELRMLLPARLRCLRWALELLGLLISLAFDFGITLGVFGLVTFLRFWFGTFLRIFRWCTLRSVRSAFSHFLPILRFYIQFVNNLQIEFFNVKFLYWFELVSFFLFLDLFQNFSHRFIIFTFQLLLDFFNVNFQRLAQVFDFPISTCFLEILLPLLFKNGFI